MKTVVLLIALLFSTAGAWAQQQFEVTKEPDGTRVLKGIISKDDITSDPLFSFAENQKGYTPNTFALEALKKYGSGIELVAFAGTWCDDTKYILPKFYSLLNAAAFAPDKVTLIGVDRNKKTLGHLAEAFNVINVPTFIVMKDGKELGRVVEYGKYGMWDKELGEVITTAGATTGTEK
ncbi:MAG TPA: thioredoxin family protein [Chitinophagaceae bacterium]